MKIRTRVVVRRTSWRSNTFKQWAAFIVGAVGGTAVPDDGALKYRFDWQADVTFQLHAPLRRGGGDTCTYFTHARAYTPDGVIIADLKLSGRQFPSHV